MSEQEKRQRKPAIGYMRTSSATNAGEGKDSEARQRKAIQAYANRAGYKIVSWHYDAAVSGADPIDTRPGFQAALDQIAGNCVRTIIVETANRFARDLAVQITGHDYLQRLGIDLIPADAPDHFRDDTPTAVMVRQILGAVAQFEKASLVAKLRGARERKKRKNGGKVEGRKSISEARPAVAAMAKELATQGMSLRGIARQAGRRWPDLEDRAALHRSRCFADDFMTRPTWLKGEAMTFGMGAASKLPHTSGPAEGIPCSLPVSPERSAAFTPCRGAVHRLVRFERGGRLIIVTNQGSGFATTPTRGARRDRCIP